MTEFVSPAALGERVLLRELNHRINNEFTSAINFVSVAAVRADHAEVKTALNLHRIIHIRDLSAVARRSPAHFSRKFKVAVGDSPHAYVVRRRVERACHLMMTSAASLSEIALSVGFSDQAHLCRLFRQAFGQSPANWRRERGIPGEVTSRAGMDENFP